MDADFVELRPGNRKGPFPFDKLALIVKQDSECRRVTYRESRENEDAGEFCWEAPKEPREPEAEGDAIESRTTVYFDVSPKVLQGGYPRAEYPTEPFLRKWAVWAQALGLKMVDNHGNELPLESYLPRRKRAKRAPAAKEPEEMSARDYSPREVYAKGDMISHQTFGPGTVRKVEGNAIVVKFKRLVKKLAHGR